MKESINWKLILRIQNFLEQLERKNLIDASEEEICILMDSIYNQTNDKIPNWKTILQSAWTEVGWENIVSKKIINEAIKYDWEDSLNSASWANWNERRIRDRDIEELKKAGLESIKVLKEIALDGKTYLKLRKIAKEKKKTCSKLITDFLKKVK